MTSTVILQQRLLEAETALHELVTGEKPVSVMREGRSVTFTSAEQGSLRAYIASLKSQLGFGGRTAARVFK